MLSFVSLQCTTIPPRLYHSRYYLIDLIEYNWPLNLHWFSIKSRWTCRNSAATSKSYGSQLASLSNWTWQRTVLTDKADSEKHMYPHGISYVSMPQPLLSDPVTYPSFSGYSKHLKALCKSYQMTRLRKQQNLGVISNCSCTFLQKYTDSINLCLTRVQLQYVAVAVNSWMQSRVVAFEWFEWSNIHPITQTHADIYIYIIWHVIW